MDDREYKNLVYAGVLGKLIGVFYGRPIEGWPYKKIRETFDVVDHYVYKEAGTPLIVADDDVAGTFVFLNAAEDCESLSKLTAKDIGETWLDYIIENKTIFWWGGLGRSTEHTAFLRLKQGISAPDSGSAKTNGKAIAEQIGAQIFMDAYAMMCPNDPEKARHFVRQLASVSHDGIAVESACLLAGMEAMAFGEKKIDHLLNRSILPDTTDQMKRIVSDVREACSRTQDWRSVRQWLDTAYGYQHYPGNCHVVPNLALILASLILGGDDFSRAMNICVSSGWDTDCNGANLGCLNGIRLGLGEINRIYDYRGPIADRMYQISSNGGACITDAVLQTRRIVGLNKKLYQGQADSPLPRFCFELPGAVQGFSGCPVLGNPETTVVNGNTKGLDHGIYMVLDDEIQTAVSTPVMWEREDRQNNYCLTGSPTLYEGQTVIGKIRKLRGIFQARPYIIYYDFNNLRRICYGHWISFEDSCPDNVSKEFSWNIPCLNGQTIGRIGIECQKRAEPCSVSAGNETCEILLEQLDWSGAPEHYGIKGSQRNYDMPGFNMTMEAFVSSAAQFSFDSRACFVISHTDSDGVVTTGTEDWKNYRICSILKPGLHQRFGLVIRARGHRRYYGVLMRNDREMILIKKKASEEVVLATCQFPYEQEQCYQISLCCKDHRIWAEVFGKVLLEAEDRDYTGGGAGFIVDSGTVLAYELSIDRIDRNAAADSMLYL